MLEWNEIVNEDREFDAVTLFRTSDMVHIAGNSPRRAERDDNITRFDRLLEPPTLRSRGEDIAERRSQDRQEKSRVTHNSQER